MSKKIIGSILVLLFLAMAGSVFADDVTFTPQVSIPGSNFEAQKDITVSDDTAMICDYIVAIYKYGIAIVGIFAVLAIAMGGVMWIVAAGNSGTIGQGKQWIISGFMGLILALGSFLLLATINKDLVTCNVESIPGIAANTNLIGYTPIATVPLVYGKPGLTSKQIYKIDNSGIYQCCLAYGKLGGTGWVKDTKVVRCRTYEAATPELAQPECNILYDDYHISGTETMGGAIIGNAVGGLLYPLVGPIGPVIGVIIGVDGIGNITDNKLKFETRVSPPPAPNDHQVASGLGIPGTLNSASIQTPVQDCFTNPATKDICKGANEADFCTGKSDGTLCLINGEFGYCETGNGGVSVCYQCLKHCDKCTEDYQCPNQKIDPVAWFQKAKNDPKLMEYGNPGTICGGRIYSFWSAQSNDCTGSGANRVCDREFDINGDGSDDPCPLGTP